MVRATLWTIAVVVWASASALCFARLWKYEAAAGPAARSPTAWPQDTSVLQERGLPTLILLMHPKCPCSRATVEELAKLMSHAQGRLVARVLMIRPDGVAKFWERTDLWQTAAAIPGVTVVADAQGSESRRFGAATSGQALLYSPDGRLLFAGGITGSRGHSGDNEGRSLVLALVRAEIIPTAAEPPQTPVYGCPLFAESFACQPDGTGPCRK
ncbi:MAG: hypothetical protein QOE14_2702 [Humisphaera sp.]|nr:hypothetical protein [Humisphaera sp.]